MEGQFVFTLQAPDRAPAAEVSRALRAYTEHASRKKLPKLWMFIDSKTADTGRSPVRTAILSTLCLGLGIFLLVPGLVKPQELAVPLIAGALAVGAGIGGFIRMRREKKQLLQKRFDKSAKKLLSLQKDRAGAEITFYADRFDMGESLSYEALDLVLESPSLFFFFWGGQVLMLQKAELAAEAPEAFSAFIRRQVREYREV